MQISQTSLSGVLLIHPKVFEDSRGYFFESFNQKNFDELNLAYDWVQDNQSSSAESFCPGKTGPGVQG
jgi:dTDP-4-dehydrorhamnose 3,5-epimerase